MKKHPKQNKNWQLNSITLYRAAIITTGGPCFQYEFTTEGLYTTAKQIAEQVQPALLHFLLVYSVNALS